MCGHGRTNSGCEGGMPTATPCRRGTRLLRTPFYTSLSPCHRFILRQIVLAHNHHIIRVILFVKLCHPPYEPVPFVARAVASHPRIPAVALRRS